MSDFLLVGLGNPGRDYSETRHNVGFLCVDAWANRHNIHFKAETKLKSLVARTRLGENSVVVAQPTTFMNLSGNAVLALTQYYKIPITQTLIILDDIDLPFGRIRFRPEGSAGSHNGMKSIIEVLGTAAIPRLRVGVTAPPAAWDLADYVLSRFTAQEQNDLPKILAGAADAMQIWLDAGIQNAMNQYNGLELLAPSGENG